MSEIPATTQASLLGSPSSGNPPQGHIPDAALPSTFAGLHIPWQSRKDVFSDVEQTGQDGAEVQEEYQTFDSISCITIETAYR